MSPDDIKTVPNDLYVLEKCRRELETLTKLETERVLRFLTQWNDKRAGHAA